MSITWESEWEKAGRYSRLWSVDGTVGISESLDTNEFCLIDEDGAPVAGCAIQCANHTHADLDDAKRAADLYVRHRLTR